jgi:hypothetical protein
MFFSKFVNSFCHSKLCITHSQNDNVYAMHSISFGYRYRCNSQWQSSPSRGLDDGREGSACGGGDGGGGGDTLFCFHQTVLFDFAFMSELCARGNMPLDLTCSLHEIWHEREQAPLTMPTRGRPSVQVSLEMQTLERFKRPSLKVHCICSDLV